MQNISGASRGCAIIRAQRRRRIWKDFQGAACPGSPLPALTHPGPSSLAVKAVRQSMMPPAPKKYKSNYRGVLGG